MTVEHELQQRRARARAPGDHGRAAPRPREPAIGSRRGSGPRALRVEGHVPHHNEILTMRVSRLSTGLRGQVTRGTAAVVALRSVELPINLAAALVLAHVLGVSGYGAYATAIGFSGILIIPATLGAPPLLV